MSHVTSEPTSSSTRSDAEPTGRLRKGTLGPVGIIVMIVAAAAPISAIVANLSLSIGAGAGVGTLGLIVVVGIIYVFFTAGYLALGRKASGADAMYQLIGYGLGKLTGSGAAFVATVLYALGGASMCVVAGYFAATAFGVLLGVVVPWWVCSAVILAGTTALCHFGVKNAARVNGVLSTVQLLVLVAFAVAAFMQAPGEISFEGFAPDAMFASGAGLTLAFLVLCFTGYEAAAAYAEDSVNPGRTIPRATYGSLIVLVVLFTLSAWAMLTVVPDAVATAQAAPGDFGVLALTLALGDWALPVLMVLLPLCFISATVSFTTMTQRYLYGLSRERLLPTFLSRVNARSGAPTRANGVQTVVTALVITGAALLGTDPFTSIVPAIAGVLGLALMVLLLGCSLSAFVAGRRGLLDGTIYSTTIAPAIASLAYAGCIVLYFVHFDVVVGSGEPWVVAATALPLVVFVIGIIAHMRRKRLGIAQSSV